MRHYTSEPYFVYKEVRFHQIYQILLILGGWKSSLLSWSFWLWVTFKPTTGQRWTTTCRTFSIIFGHSLTKNRIGQRWLLHRVRFFKPIFYFRKSNPLVKLLEIQKGVNHRIYSLREALEQFLKKRRNEKNRMTTESTTTFRPEEFTTAALRPTDDFPELSISRLSYK